MSNDASIEVDGVVRESLPNTMFRTEITGIIKVPQGEDLSGLVGRIILCHLSGKMRLHYIKILPGDKVKIEMTPYDLGKGRITYRTK